MVRNVLDAKEKNILPHQEFAGVTTVSKELMNVFTLKGRQFIRFM